MPQHTPGPWKAGNGPYGSDDGIIQAGVEVTFARGVVLTNSGHGSTSASPEDAALLALAPTAPHECDIPSCPGLVNKRKLNSFYTLLLRLKDAETLDALVEALDQEVMLRPGLLAKLEAAEALYRVVLRIAREIGTLSVGYHDPNRRQTVYLTDSDISQIDAAIAQYEGREIL